MNMKTLMLVAALAAMGSATAGVVGDAIRPWADNGQLPGAISILSNDGVEEIDCVGFAEISNGKPPVWLRTMRIVSTFFAFTSRRTSLVAVPSALTSVAGFPASTHSVLNSGR